MKKQAEISKSTLAGKLVNELKEISEVQPVEWAHFVKTGANKERPPQDEDWWYHRCASLLQKVYHKGPIGVSKLRTEYGSKKRRGHKPAEFRKASGNIIRKMLQQLEKAQLVKQADVSGHKGRIATPKAVSLLNKASR